MRFYSRIYTNSFATKNAAAYDTQFSLQKGNSFYGLSIPQYSHQVYYQLADNGAGAGNRGGKWLKANGYNISFIPPNN